MPKKTYIIVVDGELDIETLLESAVTPDEIECGCGVTIKKSNQTHHEKTVGHQLWMGKTDEEIQQSKVQCPCGLYCQKKGLKRHKKTLMHKKRMDLNGLI